MVRVDSAHSVLPKEEKEIWKLRASKLAVGAIAAVGFVFTLSGTGWARAFSYWNHKTLFDDLEKAHIKSVSESLRIVLTGPKRGERSYAPIPLSLERLKEGIIHAYRLEKGVVAGPKTKEDAEELAEKTLAIRNAVVALEKGEGDSIDALREKLSEVMRNPLYQTIAAQDSKAANFLQFIAIKLLAADANPALQNYGKKCLGELKENAFSPTELADFMSSHLQQPGFAYGGLNFLAYVPCHPFHLVQSATSQKDPLGFDASIDNPTFSSHTFAKDGKTIHFYYGPSPTGNPLFEYGVLPAYEKFQLFELRLNFQDVNRGHEYARVKEIQRMASEHPQTLRHALFGFDTKMEQTASIEFADADSYFDQYIPYVKKGVRGAPLQSGHTGLDIPDYLLGDWEVHAALEKSRTFCGALSFENPFWEEAMKTPLGRKRMAQMMQTIADTFLSLGLLDRSFDAITPEMVRRSLNKKLDKDLTAVRTSGACKQDIDRAVVANIMLRLLFRWESDPSPLTRKEVYEIAGAVLGRARIVGDRKIIWKRYLILDDFLRFVGRAPQGAHSAHALLKDS